MCQPVEESKSISQLPAVLVDLSKPAFPFNKGKKKWNFKTGLSDNAADEQNKNEISVDKNAEVDKTEPKKTFNSHKMREQSKPLEEGGNQSIELENESKQIYNFKKANNQKEDTQKDEVESVDNKGSNKLIELSSYDINNEEGKRKVYNFNRMNAENKNVESKKEPDQLDMLFSREPSKNLLLRNSEFNIGIEDNRKNEWISKKQEEKVDLLEFLADDEVDQESKEENVRHKNLIEDLEEIDMT